MYVNIFMMLRGYFIHLISYFDINTCAYFASFVVFQGKKNVKNEQNVLKKRDYENPLCEIFILAIVAG